MSKEYYKYIGKTGYGKVFYKKVDAFEYLRFLLECDFPELDPTKTTLSMALDKCFEKVEEKNEHF